MVGLKVSVALPNVVTILKVSPATGRYPPSRSTLSPPLTVILPAPDILPKLVRLAMLVFSVLPAKVCIDGAGAVRPLSNVNGFTPKSNVPLISKAPDPYN